MGKSVRRSLNLTEREIRYAISKTGSNLAAAKFLHITVGTWKKYAERVIDEETGKTLYELHKTKTRIRRPTEYNLKQKNQTYLQFLDLLEGKKTPTKGSRLKDKLINYGILENACNQCGFSEVRIDGKAPILLLYKDGNLENQMLENLEFICYNCYFINGGKLARPDARIIKEHGKNKSN